MSYTMIYGHPDDLKIRCNPSGMIELTFTCPRCGQFNYHQLDAAEFTGCFEVECDHPICRQPGERVGFTLTFSASWESCYLGTSDRPLHVNGE